MAKETRSLDPWQALRYVMVAGGSSLATHAGLSEDLVDEFTIEAIVGGLLALGGVAWGFYVRWKTAAVPVVVAAQPNVPVKDSLTGQVNTGPGV